MTRINTNVSSINAQKSLAQSNASLQEALTRLSTGLRINSGKDDPAGLIASESLRADITATEAGISNSERANQMIATADSALGQVSSLLNDIRGLVTEAANNAAMSDDQIAANQLQIDSSLAAINRIAQTTTFQGRKLLDGSLGFLYEGGTNFSYVNNLAINQANLGTASTLAMNVNVSAAATQAEVDISSVPAATAAVNATGSLTLTNAIAQSSGSFTYDGTNTVDVDAEPGEAYDGAAGNLSIVFVKDTSANGQATVSVANGVMTVNVGTAADGLSTTTTWAQIETAMEDPVAGGNPEFDVTVNGAGGVFNIALADTGFSLAGGRDAGDTTIRITADSAGASVNGKTVTFSEDATVTAGTATATLDSSDNIIIKVNNAADVTHAAIAAAIDALTGYSAQITATTGDTTYKASVVTDTSATVAMANGADASGGLDTGVTFSVGGKDGTEVLSFDAGASITQMSAAINALSDSTGVAAEISGTTLQLKSSAYGTSAFVDVRVISEAAGGTFTASVGEGTRDAGTNIEGSINGIEATGDASTLLVSNSRLDISMEIANDFTGTISFNITGGGALFQLGPEVVSNQQSRVGISSVNTADLGGSAGKLYELQSGGDKSLTGDIIGAAAVLDEVISQVTTLRGRLGAFQKTTLETNINTLNDTLEALTEAESSIRDADFAAESANLTRAQILVSSGVSVLATANQNPQNVLQLLR